MLIDYIDRVMGLFKLNSTIKPSILLSPGYEIGDKNCPTTEKEKLLWKEFLGSLMFIATWSRPDIIYSLCKLAQFNQTPSFKH